MGGGLINELLDKIWQRIADAASWMLAPLILLEWWALFAAFVFGLAIVAYFLPFKWIRAGLGFLLLLAGAFVAGGTKMYRDLRRRGD
jgi:hypothetical protein